MLSEARGSFFAFVLALILSATIANLIIWAFPPPSFSPDVQIHKHPSESHAANEGSGPDPWWEIGATVFTGIIAIYAIRQFGEGKRSSERQLRAYITISAGGIQAADSHGVVLGPPAEIIRNGTKPIAVIRIENSGQTPAYDVRMYGKMDMVDWPLKGESLSALPFSDTTVSRSVIGARAGTTKLECFPDDRCLKSPDDEGLRAGRKAIVVHGEIRGIMAQPPQICGSARGQLPERFVEPRLRRPHATTDSESSRWIHSRGVYRRSSPLSADSVMRE